MHNAEDDGYRVGLAVIDVELPPDPVEDVEAAVGAEAEEVEGVDYGRDGGLAEEEELGEDADGFEDYREGPADLRGC